MKTKPKPGRPRDPRRHAFPLLVTAHRRNLSRVARTLGISRNTAGRWFKELEAGTLIDDPQPPEPR